MTAPAIMFGNILGYPGKKMVLGVHGSFANIALLLGHARGAIIKELFYELIGRWGSDWPLLDRIRPEDAQVNEHRNEKDINLYELIPLYRVNEYDGGFYMAKANSVSRDPLEPVNYDESEYAYASRMMGSPIELTTSGNGLDTRHGQSAGLKTSPWLSHKPLRQVFRVARNAWID